MLAYLGVSPPNIPRELGGKTVEQVEHLVWQCLQCTFRDEQKAITILKARPDIDVNLPVVREVYFLNVAACYNAYDLCEYLLTQRNASFATEKWPGSPIHSAFTSYSTGREPNGKVIALLCFYCMKNEPDIAKEVVRSHPSFRALLISKIDWDIKRDANYHREKIIADFDEEWERLSGPKLEEDFNRTATQASRTAPLPADQIAPPPATEQIELVVEEDEEYHEDSPLLTPGLHRRGDHSSNSA